MFEHLCVLACVCAQKFVFYRESETTDKMSTNNNSDKSQGRGNGSQRGGDRRFSNFNKNRNDKGKGNGKGQSGKPKRQGECADLGNNVHFIGDARQADNCTKVTEAILNHIQRNFTHGVDIRQALEDEADMDFVDLMPTAPPSATTSSGDGTTVPAMDEVAKMISQSEVKHFVERKTKHQDNLNKAFALILGQCTLGLKVLSDLHVLAVGCLLS